MSGCCSERSCRRVKPPRLVRSGLSGTWYVVTDYTESADGRIVARQKHALHPDDAACQEAMRAAWALSNGYILAPEDPS